MGRIGGGGGDDPKFLQEVIAKLNALFGDVAPLKDQATFVNHITSIARENDVVMAQVENGQSRELALKGNLPELCNKVVRALTSHQKLATLLLKSDKQALAGLTDVIYDLLRDRKDIDVGDLGV